MCNTRREAGHHDSLGVSSFRHPEVLCDLGFSFFFIIFGNGYFIYKCSRQAAAIATGGSTL